MAGRPKKPLRRIYNRRTSKQAAESIEDKIRHFVVRNSRLGFFTRLSTVAQKFGMTEDRALEISGFLLAGNILECVYGRNGEVKLCEAGRRSEIRQQEHKRMVQKRADQKPEARARSELVPPEETRKKQKRARQAGGSNGSDAMRHNSAAKNLE